MKSLKYFPKDNNGMYIIYEMYSFNNFFRLLLKRGYNNERALEFVLTNCSLSAVVFQEGIFNKKYLDIKSEEALSPEVASSKPRLISDMLDCVKG